MAEPPTPTSLTEAQGIDQAFPANDTQGDATRVAHIRKVTPSTPAPSEPITEMAAPNARRHTALGRVQDEETVRVQTTRGELVRQSFAGRFQIVRPLGPSVTGLRES